MRLPPPPGRWKKRANGGRDLALSVTVVQRLQPVRTTLDPVLKRLCETLSASGPCQPPRFTQALDYELELGAVLSKPLRNATPEEALDAIGGFVVANDWSARDIQRSEMATGLGPQKCKHFCSSMSDELVDARDVLPRIDQLQAWVEINGQIVARTSGTLPFGTALESGHWLAPGDTLRMAIEGVGEIQHTWTP